MSKKGPVALGLLGVQGAGDGLAVDPASPGRVRAVALARVCVAAAARGATARRAFHEAAGEAEADLGDLGHDLALSGLARP